MFLVMDSEASTAAGEKQNINVRGVGSQPTNRGDVSGTLAFMKCLDLLHGVMNPEQNARGFAGFQPNCCEVLLGSDLGG